MSILTQTEPKIFERMANAGKPSKKTKANRSREKKVIDTLVTMDKRRKQALGCQDRAALMVLASEYAALNCPNTATQIMAEAMSL